MCSTRWTWSLVKVCPDFYDTKAIETTKRVLYSGDAVIDCGVRHQRRQGPSKDGTNMEDILLAFHRCYDLPEFVASDLSRLPPLSMHNIDFAHLLHELQGMWAVNNLPLVVNLPAASQEKSSKAAPPKTNARKVVKRVCAVVFFRTLRIGTDRQPKTWRKWRGWFHPFDEKAASQVQA